MSIGGLTKEALRWSKNHSPTILTAVAAGGVISTAILAFRAGKEVEWRDRTDTSIQNRILDDWPVYAPTAISGALTITAIIASLKVNARRQASVAAALAISEKTLYDYREKVAEIVSQRKSDQAMEEVIEDRVQEAYDPHSKEVIKTADTQTLCYDTHSGRFFLSNRQEIDWAVNRVNNQINSDMYASVNDLYDRLGLDRTNMGDELGWNGDELLEINFSSHLANGNTPCLAIDYRTKPRPYYYKA